MLLHEMYVASYDIVFYTMPHDVVFTPNAFYVRSRNIVHRSGVHFFKVSKKQNVSSCQLINILFSANS